MSLFVRAAVMVMVLLATGASSPLEVGPMWQQTYRGNEVPLGMNEVRVRACAKFYSVWCPNYFKEVMNANALTL